MPYQYYGSACLTDEAGQITEGDPLGRFNGYNITAGIFDNDDAEGVGKGVDHMTTKDEIDTLRN